MPPDVLKFLISSLRSADGFLNSAIDYLEEYQARNQNVTQVLATPKKDDYNAVYHYIEDRRQTDVFFKTYYNTHTRVDLCNLLTEEFGWLVDAHALGVNANRNSKKSERI